MAKVSVEATEVNARIVYWGIDGAGKRTSLDGVSRKLRPDHRGEMREVPTRLDPSACYTVLPIELGEIGGVRTRIEMVAAPGGPEHAPTRKQLLDQVDGIVFVADSQPERIDENLASFDELTKALSDYARSIDDMPLVVQYNKRDLTDGFGIEELHRRLDLGNNATVFEAVATDGTGLLTALSTISKKVIRTLREQSMGVSRTPLGAEAASQPAAASDSFGTAAAVETPDDSLGEPLAAEPIELDAEAASEPVLSMEEAILAGEDHPESLEAEIQSRAAESLLGEPWHHADDLAAPLGARIGHDLSIVSVGEASRADDRSVRVPLVLGDAEGDTSTVVLTIRIDPLVDEGTSGE